MRNNLVLSILFLLVISLTGFAQTYEIKFDVNNASGWYGGDDSPNSQRNVADAQSVTIDQSINLESYSVYFTSRFDFSQNPTGTGHEVTIRLHIRDSSGTVLKTKDLVLADTFSGGWATWSVINLNINTPGKYIFSNYLVGGYDSLRVNSGIRCDFNAGYTGGERFGKYVINDSDAVAWNDWSGHPWDANFRLTGTLLPTNINEITNKPNEFMLGQNYPNPFNPSTRIQYQVFPGTQLTQRAGSNSNVLLKVFDLLGNEVVELVNEEKPVGIYETVFDAQGLSSGIYFYKFQAGGFVETKKMILLR